MKRQPLPELLDCAKLARELGITRSSAEAIMRELPKVRPAALRKVYVRRSDVQAYLEQHTVDDVNLRARARSAA